MSILKIKAFSIDTTDAFTFANATVTGNITASNANLGNLVIANYFSGNGSSLFSIAGANVTGQVANALVAGTVYTAAQPNITSTGTLTSLTVSGATSLGPVGNVTITGGTSGQYLNTNGSGVLSWATLPTGGNANVAGSSAQIQYNDGTNLAASANLTFTLATKTLTVDNIVANGSGLTSITGANVTGTVASATLATFATTANAVAGANVSGTVANATYALNAGTADTANAVAGANVTGTVASATLATYATTANAVAGANVSGAVSLATYATTANAVAGANVSGTVANATYALTSGTADTANAVAGANVSGTVALATLATFATTANAVAGANVSGTVANATYALTAGTADTANAVAGANVSGTVALATLATFATTANAVAGANVSGQVGNALVAGTVYTAAQPAITSVGTLTSLAVTGALAAGDTTVTGNLTVTGTTTTVNSTVTQISDPIVELGGGANGAALSTNDGKERGQLMHYYDGGVKDAFMGWMNTNAEFTFASNVAVSNNSVTVTTLGKIKAGDANLGNAVTSNYFVGNGSLLTGIIASGGTSTTLANGTSNVNIATSSGDITMGVGGVAGVVTVTTTGVNVAGTLNSTGNLTSLNASLGNLATASYFSGNGSLLTSITGANVTGQVGSALIAATVTTAAQPNITSVGTLTTLAVSGTTNLGAVANVSIAGGSADYVLKTDGSGNLSWTALSTTTLVVDTFTGDSTWTMKTLSATPASVDYTIVAIGGVLQPRSTYSVVAAVITFSEAPPTGSTVEITTVTGGAGGGGGGGGVSYTYSAITANTTMAASTKYIVDTTTANITLTLPSTATLGDEISIIDGTGNSSTHAITIARNGGNIQGAASDMTVTTDRAAFTLAYYNATQGWLLTNV